ncbi:MAG: hypothetical protein CMP53_04515 [Flavobacteriales bacterium]|nr:hypothetical protein [Flavobacteriales bacterium]|tara:strand:- start:4343 stop:4807 length:465 start_codon:yes stop_codon:yes gene_type:complete
MKFIRRYYKNQLVKHSKPSSKRPLDTNSSVTVLHSNEMELAAVKKFFNRAQGVRFIGEKRSKEHPPKSNIIYKNDLNVKGEPVIPLPMMTEDKHFILNLCEKKYLGWYWYSRNYALRVDLQGVYEDADFSIDGKHDLEDKMNTLVKYLKMINHA